MGTFVVSLDFELHWGVRDHRTIADYRDNLLGVRRVIPALLALFSEFGVRATWATVGFLFFETIDELLAAIPAELPHYADRKLDPYAALNEVGRDEAEDPFHFERVRPENSEVERLCADATKARELLGWASSTSLEDGLRQTILWVEQNLQAYRVNSYAI